MYFFYSVRYIIDNVHIHMADRFLNEKTKLAEKTFTNLVFYFSAITLQ